MGRPPPSEIGGRTTRGIVEWNHATELLEQYSGSKWHQDSPITATMAKHVEQQNVIEMQCAGASKLAEEQKEKNRDIILKLMRSMYFWLRILFHIQSHTSSLLSSKYLMATNCLKSILVKGHLMLSIHQVSVLGC